MADWILRENKVRNQRGRSFTLIEMLVVIGIVSILAALIATAVVKMGDSAKKTQAQMDISTIYKALAEYKSKYGDYPACTSGDLEYDESTGSTNMLYLLIKTRLLTLDMSRMKTSGGTTVYLDPWYDNAYRVQKAGTAPVDGMVAAGGELYIWSYGTDKKKDPANSEKWAYLKGGN